MIQLINPRIPGTDELDAEALKRLEDQIETGLVELEKKEDEHRTAAEIQAKKLGSSDVIRLLRRRAKTDLFFLSQTILGYDRLSPRLHGNFCRWIEVNRRERFTEKLMPRATFKSTISTISDGIQCALPYDYDEGELELPYPYNLGADSRQIIVHEIATMASGYLFSITQHFMSNPMLMALFPECIPTPKKQRINSKELILPREKIWNEPTFGVMGVGARSQGLHYDRVKFDDIMGVAARDSETEMNNLRAWVDNIQAFFVRLGTGILDIVGTRYGPDDIYAHIEERYEGQLKIYRRAMEEPVLDETGNPVIDPETRKPKLQIIFPEEVSPKDLDILKKNPVVYAAQYLNDPEGGNTKFDPNWIRTFSWQLDDSACAVFNSPPFQKKLVHVRDLRTLVLWDPALSGNTGWCVVGSDQYSRHFVLEARQESISAPNAVQKWFDLYAKYRFAGLVIEEVLFSELFRHWLEAEFKLRGVRFKIIPAKTKQATKEARVLSLAAPLSAGSYFFNEKYYSRTQDRSKKDADLIYQIKKFGNIKEYHILDSLAYHPENAMPGYDPSLRRSAVSGNERDQNKIGRSSTTGYSDIKLS